MLVVKLLVRPIAETLMHWRRFVGLAFNPYRPELHYMRGRTRGAGLVGSVPSYKSPNSGGSNQFVSDSPPSITIAVPVT